jgi:hypothetical protein
MSKKTEDSWPEHPLFPVEDEGDEPMRVEFIQIVRYEDGRAKCVPRTFRADELKSLDEINALYGGGLYELIARRSSLTDVLSMGRLTGKRRYEIPGPAKALVEGASVPVASATVVTPPPGGFAPPPANGASPVDTSVMGMFMQMQMQMFQAAQENTRQQAEAQRRADDRARADSQQMMQMIAQMQAQSTQSMMGVVTAMIGTTRGGGGPEEMAKYAELFKTLGALGPKGDDEGSTESIGGIISNVADIVAGAVELKQGMPGAPPAPPGSAAGILGVPGVKKPGEL